jgi:hypothetical protein
VVEAMMEYSVLFGGDKEITAAVEIVTGVVLEYAVINRDGIEDTTEVDTTTSPEFVSDSPLNLVELVVVIDITGVNSSVEIGRSVSVGIGSIVTSRDLLVVKTDPVAFNDSVVVCFTVDSKPSMDEATVIDCIVRDPVITGEVSVMKSSVSLKGLLIVAEGTITEAEIEEVRACSVISGDEEIVAAVVIIVGGEVLEYSEINEGGSIDDSTLDAKVTDGKVDSERDLMAVLIVLVVSIAII